MAAQRIYMVVNAQARGIAGNEQPARLVRAIHPAQALRHVAEDTLAVAVASQNDLVRLLGAGVRVEQSGQAPHGEPLEP